MKRVGLLLVILLGLGVVALWSPWGRGTLLTCLVLEELLQPEGTSYLAKWSSPIVRETRAFSGPDGPREADLYLLPSSSLPDGSVPLRSERGSEQGRQARRAGVLLLHGVVDTGKDDPRLTRLARTLARAGFAVWVPEIPSMKALRVRQGDVEEVAAAFRALEALEGVDRGRLGILAFSYGAGPALIAAAQPALRERVRFLLSFGGYFDLETVLAYTTTGHFEVGGQWYTLPPEEYGKWAFLLANAELLEEVEDLRLLQAHALAKMRGRPARLDPLRLGPAGRAVWDLLANQDPARVPGLIARLSPAMRETLRALSPRHTIGDLRARLYLAHSVTDNFIPYSESVRLADAAGGAERVRIEILTVYRHVDVEALPLRELLRRDGLPLFRLVYRIVQEAG